MKGRPIKYNRAKVVKVLRFKEEHDLSYRATCKHLGIPVDSLLKAMKRLDIKPKTLR